MGTLNIVAPLAIVGAIIHLLVYGPRRAPVNSVRLSQRQWLIVGAVAIPVIALCTGLWATAALREFFAAHFGDDAVRLLFLWSVSGLLGVVVGIAPASNANATD